jgi:hypothetical protein
VLFDTKHCVDKFKLKLGCFTTVDEHGNTKIIAYSLIQDGEPKEAFIWTFGEFNKIFGSPTTIFTDGDVGMALAIVEVWGSRTVHLLCLYHIYTNLFAHMRKLFGANKAAWRTFISKFWAIATQSDIRTRGNFPAEWQEFTRLALETEACGEDVRHLALDWLRKLGERREKWAARWTWQYPTLDIHSTQRAEAIHSALAHILHAGDSLCMLRLKLEDYHSHKAVRDHMAATRRMMTQVRAAYAAISIITMRAAFLKITEADCQTPYIDCRCLPSGYPTSVRPNHSARRALQKADSVRAGTCAQSGTAQCELQCRRRISSEHPNSREEV